MENSSIKWATQLKITPLKDKGVGVVRIPEAVMKELGWEDGASVWLTCDPAEKAIILKE